jgi:hypothetical protein
MTPMPKHKKDPLAVELGRRGGLAAAGKGGRIRMAKMTARQRRALAKKAIKARWAKWRKERGKQR